MKTQGLRRAGFIAAAVVLVAAFVWVLARSGPLAPVRVVTTTVTRADIAPMLFGIGVIEARRSYLVGPTGAGRVGSVAVDVGEHVKAGQILAEMEPVDLDQRLAATTAAAARAQNAIDTAVAQLADSLARRQIAATNANRYQDLGRQGFVSISVSEGKSQELKSAEAQVSAAESAVASARQDYARLGAERAGAKQQRANLRLLAPVDGVVTARDAEAGSTVVAGQAVLRLISPDSLRIKLRLDQSRSAGLALGLPAEIVLRSRPRQTFPGKVERIEILSDSVTEERLALVSFDALPQGISVGEMSEVTLRLPAIKNSLVLPNAALRQHGGKSGVWLRNANGLNFVAVKTGIAGADGMLQILDGLKQGDVIVTHSERDLNEKTRTQVVSTLVAATK